MNVIHIAAHLGGGAGKAIVGIADSDSVIILLEKPQKTYWVHVAQRKGIPVLIEPDVLELEMHLRDADLIVINWWGHPLMVQFVAGLQDISCRLALYCHVNGCVYPYLPFSFLNEFDVIIFTTPYSYENPLWTGRERLLIENKSSVVYGMGEFGPEEFVPKNSYRKRDIFEIGYIGTLNYAKLNTNFVKYCEAAAGRVGNIRFVLAGDMAEDVREDIAQSGIADKFEYIGYVEDTEHYYKRVDVLGYLLNNYNYATTENVLLEAMAYAVPIAALNQGVEKHILKDGAGGYLVNSIEEYADAIAELYSSEKKRRALGEAARKFCVRKYSFEKNREGYKKILHRCMKIPKTVHGMACLAGKEPFEWILFFAEKDWNTFFEDLRDVFTQKSKGSVYQYLNYFPDDEGLRSVSEKIGILGRISDGDKNGVRCI